MRKSLVLATLLVLCCSMTAFAGVPDPSRSGFECTGQGASCQYRFRADGGFDCLSVLITLRDAFDEVVSGEDVTVTLTPNAGTLSFSNCCSNTIAGTTAIDGTLLIAEWCCLGGRGTLDVCITAVTSGNIAIGCCNIDFTSTNMSGDAGGLTDVVDLGLWAGGLDPYGIRSDYNCDATVDVIDLGLWAGGLEFDCTDCTCP
jgi:hypothetical protein